MTPENVLRWTARLISVCLAALFLVLIIGEGPPPIWPASRFTLLFLLLVGSFAGLVLAWKFEVVGAAIALASIVGFFLAHFFLSERDGLPGGWVFPMLLFTPLLYLAASAAAALPPRHKES